MPSTISWECAARPYARALKRFPPLHFSQNVKVSSASGPFLQSACGHTGELTGAGSLALSYNGQQYWTTESDNKGTAPYTLNLSTKGQVCAGPRCVGIAYWW